MSITPKNNMDLYQGILHLWSKFGDPSLNGWWVIAWTNLVTDGRMDRQTQATTIPRGQNWPQVIIIIIKENITQFLNIPSIILNLSIWTYMVAETHIYISWVWNVHNAAEFYFSPHSSMKFILKKTPPPTWWMTQQHPAHNWTKVRWTFVHSLSKLIWHVTDQSYNMQYVWTTQI